MAGDEPCSGRPQYLPVYRQLDGQAHVNTILVTVSWKWRLYSVPNGGSEPHPS